MLWRGPMGGGAASGAIGAMIAGHCAQGQYLKTRVKPVNPRSTFQHGTRNAMRQLAVQWQSALTSTQRDAWATYAANTTWTNRLGDTVHLSGQMEFIRSNLTLQLAGLPFVLDAPTTFDRGDVGGAPTLTLAPPDPFFTLTLNASSPWLSGNVLDGLMVYLSLPRSGGITFFKRRSRFIDRIPGTAAGSVHVFGFGQWPPPAMSQAWTSWVAAQFADGRLTTPVQTNIVLTPVPLHLRWFDDFQYPDGDLTGNDDWITAGTDSLIIVSDTLNLNPGLVGYNENQTPAAMPDMSIPWQMSIFAESVVGAPGDPSCDFNIYLNNGSENVRLLMSGNNTSLSADQLASTTIRLNATGGSTVANVPFPAGIVHEIKIEYAAGHLHWSIDGTPIASTTGTALTGASDPQLKMSNGGGACAFIIHRIETRY